MSEQRPPVAVTQEKDIRVVEFTNNKILDEANIADIGARLQTLIEESEHPRLLLDFTTVDHLSSAALGMLINVNNRIKQRNGQLRLSQMSSAPQYQSDGQTQQRFSENDPEPGQHVPANPSTVPYHCLQIQRTYP